jgi:hypothetical protein
MSIPLLPPGGSRLHFLAAVILLGTICAVTGPVFGGGGPENYLLVVNSKSNASLTIANYFVSLRQIPSSNILYVDWAGDKFTTDVETFRRQILGPAIRAIQSRNLTTHIDGIIYSSDFPYDIDFGGDVSAQQPIGDAQKKLPEQARTPRGSINGLTFHYQHVLTKQPTYLDYFRVSANLYYRPIAGNRQAAETRGFRGWYGWGPAGELLESGGPRYMLSTILGLTAGKGNTVDVVVAYLRRSASADGSPPEGTIYYTKTEDPRSKTRDSHFELAVAELKKMGVGAEIVPSHVPNNRADMAGGMFGAANVEWQKQNNTVLPGAIVDNLTSYAGDVKDNLAGQTLLTEFLRSGAAGSSGMAVEPLTIPHKFPNAFLQVHYARGCTLAEAFYQSVAAPYQLVVVGDPLCRPWAKIPEIAVEGLTEGDTVKGTLSLRPTAVLAGGDVDRFELFVDGQRIGRCGKGESFELDTSSYSDGHHELRIVGTDAGPIETQGRLIVLVVFNNHDRTMTFTASARRVRAGETVRLAASAPGAKEIWIDSNGQWLGRIEGQEGKLSIQTDRLGSGPVKLRAIGVGRDVASHVYAAPVMIEITPDR